MHLIESIYIGHFILWSTGATVLTSSSTTQTTVQKKQPNQIERLKLQQQQNFFNESKIRQLHYTC